MGNLNCSSDKKDPKILTDREISFLLSNTQYSKEEIVKWHVGFIQDCPKGILDKKQFSKIFESYYPNGKVGSFSTHIFNVFDTNQSGTIDFVEFLIALSVSSQSDVRKKLRLAFKYYDSNNNGKVDRKEMYTMIKAIFELKGIVDLKGENDPQKSVHEIFEKLDKNQNGTLNEDEFINGCIENPSLMNLLIPHALKK